MSTPTANPLAESFGKVARQLQAMIEMVEDDAPSLDVVRAGIAAKRAFMRAAFDLLCARLYQCLRDAVACSDADCRAASLGRLAELFDVLDRLLCPTCQGEWTTSSELTFAKIRDHNRNSTQPSRRTGPDHKKATRRQSDVKEV